MTYELRKLLRNPRTWIVYSFFVAGLLLFWGLALVENGQSIRYAANRYSYMAYTANKRLHDLSRPLMPGESEFLYEAHDVARAISKAYENGENTTPGFVKLRQSWDELVAQADKNGYPYADFGYDSTIETAAYLQQDEACLKRKIGLLASDWQPDAVNLNAQWMLRGGWLVVALFCLVLWMDTIGAEMDNGTFKLVFTSLTPRKTIFWSKILVSLLVAGALCLTVGLVLGGVGLVYGIGTLDYPYIVHQRIVSGASLLGLGVAWSGCVSLGLLGVFFWVFSWRLKPMDAFCACLLVLAGLLWLGAWQMELVLTLPVWRLGGGAFALAGVGMAGLALRRLERKELGT